MPPTSPPERDVARSGHGHAREHARGGRFGHDRDQATTVGVGDRVEVWGDVRGKAVNRRIIVERKRVGAVANVGRDPQLDRGDRRGCVRGERHVLSTKLGVPDVDVGILRQRCGVRHHRGIQRADRSEEESRGRRRDQTGGLKARTWSNSPRPRGSRHRPREVGIQAPCQRNTAGAGCHVERGRHENRRGVAHAPDVSRDSAGVDRDVLERHHRERRRRRAERSGNEHRQQAGDAATVPKRRAPTGHGSRSALCGQRVGSNGRAQRHGAALNSHHGRSPHSESLGGNEFSKPVGTPSWNHRPRDRFRQRTL